MSVARLSPSVVVVGSFHIKRLFLLVLSLVAVAFFYTDGAFTRKLVCRHRALLREHFVCVTRTFAKFFFCKHPYYGGP